jgi:hypothetical protein
MICRYIIYNKWHLKFEVRYHFGNYRGYFWKLRGFYTGSPMAQPLASQFPVPRYCWPHHDVPGEISWSHRDVATRTGVPADVPALDAIETLLSGAEVPLKLEDSVTFSMCAYFLTPFTPFSNIDPGMV